MTPSTTGGMPIMPLSRTVTRPRPGKAATAIQAPKGRPTRAPSAVAPRLTWKESQTMASTSGSRLGEERYRLQEGRAQASAAAPMGRQVQAREQPGSGLGLGRR